MPAPPDIYKDDVDFTSLALHYPDFAKRLKHNRQLDFTDPDSVRQLTKALLHRDFDITISLPEDRLCPPVPNRFNYILFIQRLLDSTQDHYGVSYDSSKRVIGLDIGTGASAIYPLLACRQRPSWLFLATEIDEKSCHYAAQNIESNGLDSRIKLLKTAPDSNIIIPSPELERFERVHVLLTNPPFYTSETELESLAKQKARPPNSACTGAPVEMICPGGETAFVTQIIRESALPRNRHKIQWFSSMLGKLGSVTVIIEILRQAGCTNYAVTEFVQGQKTRRWCIAWSWFGLRPAQSVARGTDAVEKKYLPFPTELDIGLNSSPLLAAEKLNDEISKLERIDWRWRQDLQVGIGRSMNGDVWSRHARRKQKKQALEQQDAMAVSPPAVVTNDGDEDASEEPEFAFKLTFKQPNANSMTNDPSPTRMVLHWLQGHDSALFESFHGWLKRKLTQSSLS